MAVSVLLPNTRLGLRRRIEAARNSHGERTSSGWGGVVGLEPGRTNENADGTWGLGADPALWPVREGDLVISDTGASWLGRTSDLIQNNYDHTVDWVRITALPRTDGSTAPPDAWFVARFEPFVQPVDPTPDDNTPTRDEAGLWTGYGPPPAGDFGAVLGDEYLDLNTGIVYELG